MDVKHSSHAQMAIDARRKGLNTTTAVEEVGCVLSDARLSTVIVIVNVRNNKPC